MRTLLAFFLLCAPIIGAEFDGLCRMSEGTGKQWSGVAISDSLILTVAHHDERGEVFAEFPEGQHGNATRIRVPAKVLRANALADLCLVEYKCPAWATVKTYPVRRLKRHKVTVKGYIMDKPTVVSDAPIVTGEQFTAEGYVMDVYAKNGLSGMSGSPALMDGSIVGIQSLGSKTHLYCVQAETIEAFLKEAP